MPNDSAYRVETLTVESGTSRSDMPVLVFEPDTDGPHPTLVIAQHLPVAHTGLENDPFQIETGKRYAAAGFTCVMPFVFHWWPTDTPIETKREEFRDDWTIADLTATVNWIEAQPTIDSSRIGILGHCWGGRIAWLGACHLPMLKGCAVFYGGRVNLPYAGGAPAPITLADGIACPVLGIFGNDDENPGPADVDAYESALKSAGVDYAFHRYDGAGHGFQDFTNDEKYRETQSEDAWQKSIAFFRTQLT